MFSGTTHYEDWVFYHDVLSQMKNNEIKEWTKIKTMVGTAYQN